MKPSDHHPRRLPAGFTLPAVLVIIGALLILAVGLLAVTGVERRTARSYVDLQRAEMATRAGLEEVKGLLDKHTANDDFLIVSQTPALPQDGNKQLEKAPYLYLAKGRNDQGNPKFKYYPLFSTEKQPTVEDGDLTNVPLATDFVGKNTKEIETLPYMNPAFTAWVPIRGMRNGKEQTVARYAYYVEDLQGKVNPKVAGNDRGDGGIHTRSKYPFPAPGLSDQELSDKSPALDGIAIHALDEKAGEEPEGDLVKRVVDGREYMISPRSILGAAGFSSPVKRDDSGLPEDKTAAALERNTSPVLQPYEERPVIPFAQGISATMSGSPKLNLNMLLSEPRDSAINQFADHVQKALPFFAEKRPGGFATGGDLVGGDDYLKTLAANALDYADADSDPSVKPGEYRGLDAYPVMSEVILRTDYTGRRTVNNQTALQFTFGLYVEFWNMTSQTVSGDARVSYEAALNLSPIGVNPLGPAFDSPAYLENSSFAKSVPQLEKIDGKYYFPAKRVTLKPDAYELIHFGNVQYIIPVGASNMSGKTAFHFEESRAARGITFQWNGVTVERAEKLLRDAYATGMTVETPRYDAKATIMGNTFYNVYGEFYNNMGDPRMSHYFRLIPLGENSYPSNISPNRRNVRKGTIYGSEGQQAFYGRVMPSEWPDRGHDSSFGGMSTIPSTTATPLTLIGKYPMPSTSAPHPGSAPQRISNAGRFYSVTELGNVYDPVMWSMVYDDLKNKPGTGKSDTLLLVPPWTSSKKPAMPTTRNAFPDVTNGSVADNAFGGGNTLRIGRYEHQRFDYPGLRASDLVELFHAGKSTSGNQNEREGDVVEINGHININTASKDTLRAMISWRK
jgi:type II secretory pathway pseudopilin PulG